MRRHCGVADERRLSPHGAVLQALSVLESVIAGCCAVLCRGHGTLCDSILAGARGKDAFKIGGYREYSSAVPSARPAVQLQQTLEVPPPVDTQRKACC